MERARSLNLIAAFDGISKLYVDSAPLIYYVEEHKVYVDKMEQILHLVENTSLEAVSSVLTLSEVLVMPVRLGAHHLTRRYRSILMNREFCTLVSISADIAIRAASIRARYRINSPDALHIATAIEFGCDAFLTNDHKLRAVQELTVLVLDDLVP